MIEEVIAIVNKMLLQKDSEEATETEDDMYVAMDSR